MYIADLMHQKLKQLQTKQLFTFATCFRIIQVCATFFSQSRTVYRRDQRFLQPHHEARRD